MASAPGGDPESAFPTLLRQGVGWGPSSAPVIPPYAAIGRPPSASLEASVGSSR